MPKGPKGGKRPADVIGNAIMGAKIVTGELEEQPELSDDGKDAVAVSMGGGAERRGRRR